MTTQNEVIRAFRDFAHASVFLGWRKMLTGRRTETNTITLAGAPAGKTWVRAHDASREQTAVWGFVGIPNVTVWVAPGVDGENRIMAIDYSESVQAHGDKVLLAQQPPLDGNLNTVLISGQNFQPGRLRAYSESGSMLVYAEPFAHALGYYAGGTIDLTGDVPSTSGTNAWVAVALDPATDTLYAYQGGETYDSISNLDVADAHAIAIPDGYIPLGAVALNSDTTEITPGTRIIDLRPHINSRGLPAAKVEPAFGVGEVKTLASDVAAAGDDRHLILAAESGTADDCIEITDLEIGEEVIVRADSGDTITLKHDDAGATDKILLYGGVDYALSNDRTMKLVKIASGKLVQYVDQAGTGSGGEGASVTKGSAQSIADITLTAITFGTEEFDTDDMHSTSVNTERISIPATGVYIVTGGVQWASGTTGFRYIALEVNGTTNIAEDRRNGVSGQETEQTVSRVYAFTAGDYVVLNCYQNSSAAVNISSGAQTFLSVQRLA